jgi:hypothetical protein
MKTKWLLMLVGAVLISFSSAEAKGGGNGGGQGQCKGKSCEAAEQKKQQSRKQEKKQEQKKTGDCDGSAQSRDTAPATE